MIFRCAVIAGITSTAACAVATAPVPADRQQGAALYAQCTSCHSLEPGENLPSGPTLHAIVGKPVAAESGFAYSSALRQFAVTNRLWTTELLDRFTADPEELVPGTHMAFHGIADESQRAALIDYLQRQE